MKTRARHIAMAARRYKLDHPAATFSTAQMGKVTSVTTCGNIVSGVTLQTLVNCGYLDYRQYKDENASHFTMKFTSAGKVCFKGNSTKILDSACYCTDGENNTEDASGCN